MNLLTLRKIIIQRRIKILIITQVANIQIKAVKKLLKIEYCKFLKVFFVKSNKILAKIEE